jgi:FO synthase
MRYDNDLERVQNILNEIMHSSRHLSRDEALSLFCDATLEQLIECSSYLRNKFKPSILTYSRKVFVNLINLCRDTCTYCTYKKEPGEIATSMLDPDKVLAIVEVAKRLGCTEALVVTGERPEIRYPEVQKWLKRNGFSTLSEYLGEVCEMILKKTGLLPHTNAGSLSKQELLNLRENNASMGLMLESSSIRLSGRGMPHERAPSKHPKVRIKSLTSCGELNIPTTTGLLVGIGETPKEIVESLLTIRALNESFGHIQEIIMQNFTPKHETLMSDYPAPSKEYYLRAVAVARILMPSMNIQVPPNLSDTIDDYIGVGINDWGGISPVTIDYVNPEHPWPSINYLDQVSLKRGFQLKARFPVYPEFLNNGRSYISQDVRSSIEELSDGAGLVKGSYLV